jgi:glycosyltransferase involved in cell wall biosynthesis
MARSAMASSVQPWITACIPHYRCRRYVARAVESLLTQTYRYVRVIVINDGDPETPWPQLAHLKDPRIVRFSIQEHRGPYFCTEIVRQATPDPFFLIQDADDWSDPQRAEELLHYLMLTRSDFAVSAQPQFREARGGVLETPTVRWSRLSTSGGQAQHEHEIDGKITHEFRYRAPHHGLFRGRALADVGGYYGGFFIGYDALLTNVILMTGSLTWTPTPLYYRFVRDDSLTHAPETKPRSRHAAHVQTMLRNLYRRCYLLYRSFAAGHLSRSSFREGIRVVCTTHVTGRDHRALALYANSLREKLHDA